MTEQGKRKAYQYRQPAALYAKPAQHQPMTCNAPTAIRATTERTRPVTENVTSEPNGADPVTKRVTVLEARVAQIETIIETMRPKSAAERKRASRERKKQQAAVT